MGRCIGIKDILCSSLWMTVLIVRVGCIIEAHASTTVSTTMAHISKESREDLSASLVRQSGVKKKITASSLSSRRLFTSRNLSGAAAMRAATTTAAALNALQQRGDDSMTSSEEDTCTIKGDGYFPNFGSDCTSYYFCAAGYQITFVCPPGARFNKDSKKCENDVKCGSEGHKNICDRLPNGYYPKGVNSRKYFYCFNNAKVIELQCDEGKIYRGNKCILSDSNHNNNDNGSNRGGQPGGHHHQQDDKLISDSCEGKPNGFYPVLDSGCSKYYFCIGQAKTDLTCQAGMIFNGDICVQESSYKCPESISISGNSISPANNSNNNNGNKEVRSSTDPPEQAIRNGSNSLATEAVESTTATSST